MGKTKTIDIDYLRQRLRYEPETGKLYWLDYEGVTNKWRVRFAGKEAFIFQRPNGYKQGQLDGLNILAHRAAWALHYAGWPDEQIDHINGIRDDNRIANLRAVSSKDNNRNRKRGVHNTSGAMGVHWDKGRKKWLSFITEDNRFKNLGRFDTIEEATKARKEAEVKYGFHENHGRD